MGRFFDFYCAFTRFYSHLIEDVAGLFMRRKKQPGLIERRNVSYLPDSRQTKLDYCYRHGGEKKPVFIYIHGGGFISGHRWTKKYYCRKWADKGFFTVSIGYDYAPKIHHPEQLQQIFCAIEKLLDDQNLYYLDTEKIVVSGESAGAFYTSFVTAASKNHRLYDTLGIKFKYADSFDVKATVLICGIFDIRSMINIFFLNIKTYVKALSGLPMKKLVEEIHGDKCAFYNPIASIDKSFPPSVIISAKHDTLKAESYKLEEHLKRLNVEHIHFVCDGLCSFHAFPIAADMRVGRLCLSASQKFIFEKVLGKGKL